MAYAANGTAYNVAEPNLLDEERKRIEEQHGGKWQWSVRRGCFIRIEEREQGAVYPALTSGQRGKGHYAATSETEAIDVSSLTPESKRARDKLIADLDAAQNAVPKRNS